jgi:hypothetical protein
MIITRGITHKVNMAPGSYESVELHGSVTIDSSDLKYSAMDDEQLSTAVQDQLDRIMEEDVTEAARCVDPEGDSYITSWKDGR